MGYRRVNGAMSSADPNLRNLLIPGGTLIKSLIWNPLSYAVVYGRSLSAYCLVQGLLLRQVPPHKILLVLPPRGDEDNLCVDGFRLVGVQQDNRERLKALVLADTTGNDVPTPA